MATTLRAPELPERWSPARTSACNTIAATQIDDDEDDDVEEVEEQSTTAERDEEHGMEDIESAASPRTDFEISAAPTIPGYGAFEAGGCSATLQEELDEEEPIGTAAAEAAPRLSSLDQETLYLSPPRAKTDKEAVPTEVRAIVRVDSSPAGSEDLDRALSQLLEEVLEEPQDASQSPSAPSGTGKRWLQEDGITVSLTPSKKMTSSSTWCSLWQQLTLKGWRIDVGPRGDQYYMPPGVSRGNGMRNRHDYFDSKLQVVRHLRDTGCMVIQVTSDDSEEEGEEDFSGWKQPKTLRPPKTSRPPPPKRAQEPPKEPDQRRRTSPARKDGDWQELWDRLLQAGWSIEQGPRGDPYYMPPGVKRGPGAKVRVDYFDSRTQVRKHVASLVASSTPTPSRGKKRPRASAK